MLVLSNTSNSVIHEHPIYMCIVSLEEQFGLEQSGRFFSMRGCLSRSECFPFFQDVNQCPVVVVRNFCVEHGHRH